MFDLNKLSYEVYGELVIGVLVLLAILLNISPFSLIGLVLCLAQIPIYLYTRTKLVEPIHANGLNLCFVLTIIFYALLFICIKMMIFLIDLELVICISTLLTMLGCYATSTVPNKMSEMGKLFFGYKKHNESKYQKLIDYIKFNGINPDLIEAENRLKEIDAQMYLVYKRKFREDKTFKDIAEEFDIENPRIVEILDRTYFYMIGTLKI